MSRFPQPEIILTHESDLDGLLSGLLCQRLCQAWFQTEVPLQAFHNNSWRQRQPFETAAWVCDLTFEPRLDRPNWVIIDHHPYDNPPQQAQLIHHLDRSAGTLVYDICRAHQLGSDSLDRLVHLNDVADRFLIDDPEFDTAIDHANLVKAYGFWNLLKLIGQEPEALLDHPLLEVMRLKRKTEDPIGLAWSRDHITPLPSEVGLVETVVGNNNLIVHQLLQDGALPYKVLLTLTRRGTGNYLVSLRSRDGEALAIAQKLKGGGHPNACGAALPRSVQSLPDAVSYLTQILAPETPRAAPKEAMKNLFDGAGF